MEVFEYILAVLPGIAAIISLIIALVKFIHKSIQEKNWAPLLGLIMSLMEKAEDKFEDGATRKEWVMAMVKTSAEYINYPVDTEMLSTMIDSLCDMTKVINVKTEKEEEAAVTDEQTASAAV